MKEYVTITDVLDALILDVHAREPRCVFDAGGWFSEHMVKARRYPILERNPPTDAEVADALRTLVRGAAILGGGAVGYLALIDMITIAFREDHVYADDMLVDHIVGRAVKKALA